jgi:hypothetical protein
MGVGGEVTKAGGWMLFLGILYVIGGIPNPVVNQPSPLPPLRRVREEDVESVS